MRLLATAILAAGLLTTGAGAQAPVQTIELPSLDRSLIAFRLNSQPSMVIGPANFPGGYYGTLNQVARLSDGRASLATPWGNSRLHVVDPSGKAVQVGNFNGRAGSLQTVCATGDDRLLVFHDRTQFTFFRPSGEAQATGAVPDRATLLCPAGGSQVWLRISPLSSSFGPSETPPDPAVTSRRTKVVLRRVDLAADSRVLADLGEFEAADYYSFGPIPRMQGNTRPPIYSWRQRPFARDLAIAVDGARLHAGDGSSWEVRTWDGSGRLIRILRVQVPVEPVTPELRASFIESEFAGNTEGFRARSIQQQRLLDQATYPAALPAFSALRVDRTGRLWVRRYPKPMDTTQEWWVFTADARYMGRVEIPAAFSVEDIGADYIAGNYLVRKAIRAESDGLSAMNFPEYDVRVYRIVK
jgi:hypothetical protein